MFHRQVYVYRYHRAKMELILQDYKNRDFKPLKQLLDVVTTECPHQLFLNSARSSETKNVFSLDGVRISEKVNYAVRLAEVVLQAVTDNKLRHDAVQKFMLANDSVTVATEVPVFLDQDDLHHMKRELEFDIPHAVNSKHEYRNPKQIRNPNIKIRNKNEAQNDRISVKDGLRSRRSNAEIRQGRAGLCSEAPSVCSEPG